MKQELDLHGYHINKYILAHDTSIVNGHSNDSLYKVLEDYAKKNRWEIIERGTTNVGYTVLKKK